MMSLASLGFLTLLGAETAAMAVLLWRADAVRRPTLEVSANVINVMIVSAILNAIYLVFWFMHIEMEAALR